MKNIKCNKGKIAVLVVLAVVILILAGISAYKSTYKKLKYGIEAYTVVSDYFKQPEYSIFMSYDVMTDKNGFYTEAILHKNTVENKEITY